MMSKAPIYGLMLLSAAFAAVGFTALLAPDLIAGPVEIALPSASAYSEFRAGYGGLFLGLSLLFATGARDPARRSLALGIATLVLGVFSAGRLLSWAVDGKPNPYSMLMHGLETTGFGLSLFLWWRSH